MAGQTDSAVAAILRRIDDGLLNPGDGIDEDALMAEMGISRTPLREAFLKLEAEGLVLRLPRKGVVVFKPTLPEFLAILEVHAHLEGQAAGLAARRLSVDRGRALEAAVAACTAHFGALGDSQPDRYYQLNIAFHKTVAEAAGNPFLLALVKSNARKLMAYYRARYRYAGVTAASVGDHQRIAALILDRDGVAAQAAMTRHVQFDQVTAMDLLATLG